MTLTFDQFSEINRARCESEDGFGHRIADWSTSDWMTATMGELGEAANIVKKLNCERDGIIGNVETRAALTQALGHEIADTFIYLDLLTQSLGLNLADLVVAKFNLTSVKIDAPHTIPVR